MMPRTLLSAAKTPWGWAAAGLLIGGLLAALVFAPARWLASAVNQGSGGLALLEDARGTVWHGSATLTLTGGAGSQDAATLPSRLGWQIQPAGMGLQLQVTAPCCLTAPWTWQVKPLWGGARLSASDTLSNWPAQMLAGLGTPFNTLDLQGKLALTPSGLQIGWAAGRLQMSGQLKLEVQDLSSRLSTLRPMGSYQMTLNGGATPTLQLATLSGPLQLSGSGQWVGGKLRFNGEATAAAEHQAALANLLNIIGRRNGARSIIKLG